jgi:hypothetical protein
MGVLLLTKVTCSYSEVEDRIRMSAMMKGGEPVVFWLTLRMCCRIVRELNLHLERSVSKSALVVDMGLLLSCKQRDAEWQHKPSEPVNYSKNVLLVLPPKVSLSCSKDGAALLFPLIDGQDAKLQMSLQELRQWLAILYRQFTIAGWPMDVWPDWFMSTKSGRN